jgi:hypothetical protein
MALVIVVCVHVELPVPNASGGDAKDGRTEHRDEELAAVQMAANTRLHTAVHWPGTIQPHVNGTCKRLHAYRARARLLGVKRVRCRVTIRAVQQHVRVDSRSRGERA